MVRGEDTLLVENFNDGDAAGWSTGPDQGITVGVGTAADFGIPALGADDKIGHVPALSSGEKFFLSPLPGVPAGTTISSYTLVYDLYVPLATAGEYTSLFQTDVNNASDAELFIRKTGATHRRHRHRRQLSGRVPVRRLAAHCLRRRGPG